LKEPGSLQADQKYGFLLSRESMPFMLDGRGDFLPEATALAIEQLSKDPDGFFLMVEGSQIDWAAHDNEGDYLVAEMLDFENVIAVVMDFAEKDGNTLVVVTADHETGGFTLSEKKDEETGDKVPQELGPTFVDGGHSATLVPVFAYGPGASEFMGIYDNTGLFHKMAALAGNTQ
jgi:alkaline phosphatase